MFNTPAPHSHARLATLSFFRASHLSLSLGCSLMPSPQALKFCLAVFLPCFFSPSFNFPPLRFVLFPPPPSICRTLCISELFISPSLHPSLCLCTASIHFSHSFLVINSRWHQIYRSHFLSLFSSLFIRQGGHLSLWVRSNRPVLCPVKCSFQGVHMEYSMKAHFVYSVDRKI